jgi:hypothetical protein
MPMGRPSSFKQFPYDYQVITPPLICFRSTQWNKIEEQLQSMEAEGKFSTLPREVLDERKKLRLIRNEQVHSSRIDKRKIEMGISIATKILQLIAGIA